MSKRFQQPFFSFFTVAFLLIFFTTSANTAELTVQPGKFDHFNITVPDKVVAGQESFIKLETVDSLGNIVTNYNDSEKVFSVSVTGSASVNPELLRASALTNGTARISIIDKVAETVRVSIAERGAAIRSIWRNIQIVPDRLHSLTLRGPGNLQVQAGTKFEIEIIAKDMYGNIVGEPINGKGISLSFKGEAEPKLDMVSIPDFINGMSFVKLVSNKAGTFVLEARDVASGSAGISDAIEVINAPLHSFKIFAPLTASAGDPFEVSIVAVDQFDNPVATPALSGNKVMLNMGKLKPVRATIPTYQFVYGQAKVELHYDAPENISIMATDGSGRHIGRSEMIKIVPVVTGRFEVKTPDSAIAGQKFKMLITAYNQAGKVMKNYHLVGPDVRLTITGTGTLVPNQIPATEFINGVAVVDGFYNKSETFKITASAVDYERQTGTHISTKDGIKHRISHRKKSTHKATASKTLPSKAKETIPPEKKTTEGAAAKAPSPPVSKERAIHEEKKVAKKTEKAPSSQISKATPSSEDKKPSETSTKVALAPIPKEKIPPSEKKAETSINGSEKKTSGTRKPFELTEITIDENSDRSVLSFHIPNIDKSISYKVSTEVFNEKTWIILRTKPLINNLVQPFTIDSSVVVQVLVNQDQEDKLTQLLIIIQLKPTPFHVTREKDVLKVTMKRSRA